MSKLHGCAVMRDSCDQGISVLNHSLQSGISSLTLTYPTLDRADYPEAFKFQTKKSKSEFSGLLLVPVLKKDCGC